MDTEPLGTMEDNYVIPAPQSHFAHTAKFDIYIIMLFFFFYKLFSLMYLHYIVPFKMFILLA